MNIDKKNMLDYIILFQLLIISLMVKQIENTNLSIAILFAVFIYLLINSFTQIKKNYLFIIFLVVFFVFTMGQYIFPLEENMLYYKQFNTKTITTTILIQTLALIFTYIGHSLKKEKKTTMYETPKLFKSEQVKKISLVILTLFLIISVLTNLEKGIRVMQYGYLIIYTNEIPSSIPGIYSYLATFFPLLVLISLGLFKEKKDYVLIISMYFIYLCFTLLTGVGGEFCTGLIIIFIYTIVNKYIINNTKTKNIVRLVSALCIVVPFMAIGLNILNSARNNAAYSKDALSQFRRFFVNQGVSVNLISTGIENKYKLDKNKHMYTFGPVIENIESKLSTIKKVNLTRKIHTSYARDITLIELGEEAYYSGQGLGSQYLGELFVDYGYLGIIIYSIVLGFIIKCISEFYKYNYVGYSISLILIQSLLFLPRNQSIQFINSIISFNYWGLILLITLYITICKRSNKNV